MSNPNAEQLEYEKILYRYTSALARGDFETVAAILKQAEEDETLAEMVLDLNETYQDEFAEQEEQAGQQLMNRLRRTTEIRREREWLAKLRQWFGRLQASPAWRTWAAVGVTVVVLASVTAITSFWKSNRVRMDGQTSAYTYDLLQATSEANLSMAYPAPGTAYVSQGTYHMMYYEPVKAADESSGADYYAMSIPASGFSMQPSSSAIEWTAMGDTTVNQQATDHLLVRTGGLQLLVEDTRATQDAIQNLIKGMAAEGAFVVSASESGGEGDRSPVINMEVRVPVDRFDDTMAQIAGLAIQVLDRQEIAQDVTEEYVDLGARLESMEAARDRLMGIMATATKVADLLDIERQLTEREAEIEALKGRMQYLEQSARLSSINIILQPDVIAQPIDDPSWRPGETARTAFDDLLAGLQNLADGLIYFGIATLTWLVPVGLLVFVVVRYLLRRYRKVNKASE